MSYFMRYIFTQPISISLKTLEDGLTAIDPAFAIFPDMPGADTGDLAYEDDLYGTFSIAQPVDTIFQEDIDELKEAVGYHDSPRKAEVLAALDSAAVMLALEVLEAGDANLARLDPFWDWLFARYPGMLQVDEEGFFDASGRVLTLI